MKVFVIMPFDQDFDDVYDQLIKEPFIAEGFEVERADDIQNQENILKTIIDSIIKSDFIVSDLSGNNPNVFYEMALAHAFKKKVILISQDIGNIPFDIRSYRVIKYGTHFSEMRKAIIEIKELIHKIKNGEISFGSPVSDFVSSINSEELTKSYVIDGAMQFLTENQGNDEQIEEFGILDYQIMALDGMGKMTNSLNNLTNDFLNPFSDELNKLSKLIVVNKRDPRKNKILLQDFSKKIDNYVAILLENNSIYTSSLNDINTGLSGMFDPSTRVISQDDKIELKKFISEFTTMGEASEQAINKMEGLMTEINKLPRVERMFDRAKKIMAQELGTIIDNLENTKSMSSRAVDMASNVS